ncbi:hypothetical protein OHA27_36960 [Streptomyces sp. NBC_01619]|uniref:hypothetical protein n=1 Tax=Streptomyces sp. NBC_01619 TaxID=2975901 RepID=UPI00224D27F1|nr:hypothetical protein [Streptomyces sp. NBC_01619]MCX4515755.1 hypothetical protein [Streptomyces sp. NBC_01619]
MLFPREAAPTTAPLEEIALAPSERRLYRESEQVYRVLSVASAALCSGTLQLGRPLLVSGIGGTDLSSLRGFMRAVEHARVVEGAELLLHAPTSVRRPVGGHADYQGERVRCLRRMGLSVTEDDLVRDLSTCAEERFVPLSEEGELYLRARDDESSCVDRVAAALAYCRRAFFSANWEGMAIVADEALGLLARISKSSVPHLLAKAQRVQDSVHADEFETAILRGVADVRGLLLKVLGIQASFRGDANMAIACFRAMRDAPGLSPEIRAQSHFYSALALSQRKQWLAGAVAEVEHGFDAVREKPNEAGSVRRERGWLHNLRGLTLFSERRLAAAFEHEKQALACTNGLTDAGTARLRINLYSNISVLYEKAGKHTLALAAWEKFKEATGSSNAGFVKHHAYRSAGLRLLTGEWDAVLEDLDTTLAHAARAGDSFHETEVRLELGALHATAGDAEDATDQYRRAENAARLLGDPYRIALAQAGQVMLSGSVAVSRSAAATAALSLSRPGDADVLARAVTEGCELAGLLPRPRTKLNRPFDLINF